nr:integrase, catalytic region, zinc finger, CCHC-type, peptidase aspartic, catalytic [Tanacetum cinerariifolium]
MDLCGPMRVASINGKRYVLVIVNDYSRYTWTHFLRSKDETPKVLIDFLRLVQRGLQAQVRVVRTNKGTEFLNQTLHAYFSAEGIKHQTSIARTPEQNNIVERRNHIADPLLQDLDLLFSHMYKECFTVGNQSVSKSFALFDNSQQHDTQPTLNVQPTIESIVPPTNVNVEENNTNQAENAPFEAYEFINLFAPSRP